MIRRNVIGWCVLAVLILGVQPTVVAQEVPAPHEIQAIVVGLRSVQQAYQVDQTLRSLRGVQVSRTDVNTKNLFMLVSADCSMERSDVEQLLAPMGLTVHCWQRAPRSTAPFRHLDADHCIEQHLDK